MGLDNIPQELRKLDQWVVWQKGGKNAKRPYNARTGYPAKVDDPNTWSTYEEAAGAVENGKWGGVGFVFTEHDSFCFIDLDDVIDPKTGDIDKETHSAITRFDSYTEISQSGRGIHIIIKGEKPGDRSRSERAEIYDRDRYAALTGDLWPETPLTVEKRQAELSDFYGETFVDGTTGDETEAVYIDASLDPDADVDGKLGIQSVAT